MVSKNKYIEYLIIIVLTAAVFAFSGGCKSRREGKTLVIPYEIKRAEWISEAETRDIPEEVMSRRVDVVKPSHGYVWFGLRDYGVAGYDTVKKSWGLYPIKWPKEIAIWGIEFDGRNIYAGSSGPGLWRYDLKNTGQGWVRLDNSLGLKANEVNSVAQRGKSLWTTTFDGLYRYDIESKKFERAEKGMFFGAAAFGSELWAFEATSSGRIRLFSYDTETGRKNGEWTSEPIQGRHTMAVNKEEVMLPTIKGYMSFDKRARKFELHEAPADFPNFLTRRIIPYDTGYLIVTDTNIVYFDPSKREWLKIDSEIGLPKSNPTCVGVSGGRIFLGMEKGAAIIEPKLWKQMKNLARENCGAPDDKVLASIAGRIEAGDRNIHNWLHFTVEDGLLHNRVSAILPADNEVWIGTEMAGVSHLNLKSMKINNLYFPGAGRGQAAVMELARDGDNIWHGGYSFYGAFNRTGKRWTKGPYPVKGELGTNIEAVWADADQVWIGVRKQGIRVLDKATGKWTEYAGDYFTLSPLNTDIVKAKGAIWVASDIGLRRFDASSDRFTAIPMPVIDIETMSAEGDTLWLGAREKSGVPGPNNTGLHKLNLETHHYVRLSGVPGACGGYVNKVFADGPYVWVAAQECLSRYDRLKGAWTSYGAESGLEAGNVLSVSVGADNLFVGTDSGLYIRPVVQFESQAARELYVKAWKLEHEEDYQGAALLYKNLLAKLPPKKEDMIRYRLARCLELSGKDGPALVQYEQLLERNPLLLLDLEGIYSKAYGFDSYIKTVESLSASLKPGAGGHALCKAHIQYLEMPLEHYAVSYEKSGDAENAEKYWSLLLDITESTESKKKAKRHLAELDQKNRLSRSGGHR